MHSILIKIIYVYTRAFQHANAYFEIEKPHQIGCRLQTYATATFLLYRSASQTKAYPKSYEK